MTWQVWSHASGLRDLTCFRSCFRSHKHYFYSVFRDPGSFSIGLPAVSSRPGRLVMSLAPAGAVGHSCIQTRMWSNDPFCFQLSPPLLWQCLSVAPYVTLTLIYFLLFLSFRDTPTAGSSCLLERWRLWWLLVAIGAELEFCCSPWTSPQPVLG